MKQVVILSVFLIVAFIQLINAEQAGSESEDLSSISSAELIRDLERLRNEKIQSELESNVDQISENEALKQKRGRRNNH